VGVGLLLVSAVGLVSVLVADPTSGTQTPADAAASARAAAAAAPGTEGAIPTIGPPTNSPSASASPTKPAVKKDQGGCPVSGGGSACPSAPPLAAASGKKWKLAFSEEFTGTSLNRSKLSPCFDWNYGDCTATFNHGREYYQPSQVKVSGGTAKLIAAPTSARSSNACQNGTCTYKAGLLSTARPRADNGSDYLYKFTYGYVESRFKFPATQGFFTAFWMLPTDEDYNYRTEIDILELLGDDPTTMFMTYHYDNRSEYQSLNKGKFNNGACPVKDYSKGFVRMGLDWQPNHIAWYIDGKKCGEYTDASRIEDGPMQLILHMMVDNDWQREWKVGLKDDSLTRQLEVDYIRVYQQVSK
jgi:beta-glucanase (GH16 family)